MSWLWVGPWLLFWGGGICQNLATAGAQTNAATGPTLFVSPRGNDTWSGTLENPNANGTDGPFATLEQALKVHRQSANGGQESPDIVIREGNYPVTKTVELTANDSGSADHPFKISAYPGEHPVFDGGMKLSGTWQKQQAGPLWSLQLTNLPHPVEDLFLKGEKLPRSRLPSTGFWHALNTGETENQIHFPSAQFKALPDAANGVFLIKPNQWYEETVPIQSIDEKTQTITLTRKTNYPLLVADWDHHAGESYIENLREGIDGPGKWCFDPVQKTLWFWPPEDLEPNQAEFVAGGLPLLISVAGDAPGNHWAEHVIFDGLTFSHAGRYESVPYVKGGALRLLSGVRNCEVRHCRFIDLGGDGIMLLKNKDNLISGNEFTGVGGAAVRIYDYLGKEAPTSSGNHVENNVIHHCGTIVHYSSGIDLENTCDNIIAHNLIFDQPYDGISLMGDRPDGWPAVASPDLKPPYTSAKIKPFVPTQGNVIEYNHVHNVMEQLADGGGIYLWGVMGGKNYVRHNLIEHVGEGTGAYEGIYLDDECDDAVVTDNIVCDSNYAFLLHGASRNLLQNNIFAYSRENDVFVQPEKYNVFPMDTVLKNNIYYQCTGSVFRDASWAPWDRRPLKESDYNIYWQNGTPLPLGQGNFKDLDVHSLVQDPQFVDPEHGDFQLKPTSPALQLGIHSIDIRGVGPGPSN